jgi:UrcA family protein
MRRSVKSAFLAFAVAAAMATTASADPVHQKYSVRIKYADLDLATEAGALTAIKRVDEAAQTACGERPSPRLIMATQAHQACVGVFTRKAIEAIGSPVLTALLERSAPALVASR